MSLRDTCADPQTTLNPKQAFLPQLLQLPACMRTGELTQTNTKLSILFGVVCLYCLLLPVHLPVHLFVVLIICCLCVTVRLVASCSLMCLQRRACKSLRDPCVDHSAMHMPLLSHTPSLCNTTHMRRNKKEKKKETTHATTPRNAPIRIGSNWILI